MNNNQKNSFNYKIAKCKNWEQDGTCKYGIHCTFAHGDNELRNKSDNMIQMQPGMGMMIQPFMMNMQSVMQMHRACRSPGLLSSIRQLGRAPLCRRSKASEI